MKITETQNKIFEEIENMVDDIYEEFHLEEYTGNLKELIKAIGGNLIIGTKNSITKKDDSFIIELDNSMYFKEKKKTLYELIGYLFLVMGYTIDKTIWNKSSNLYLNKKFSKNYFKFKINPFIKYFANAFLLPRKEFTRLWELERTDLTVDIVSLAEIFNVSPKEITNRATTLGLIKEGQERM